MELDSCDIVNTAALAVVQCRTHFISIIRELAHERDWTCCHSANKISQLCDMCSSEITGVYRRYRCSKIVNLHFHVCNNCDLLSDSHRCNDLHCDGITAECLIKFREQALQYHARVYDALAYMNVSKLASSHSIKHIFTTACSTCNMSMDFGMRYVWPAADMPQRAITYRYNLCIRCHDAVSARARDLYTCGRVLLTVQLLQYSALHVVPDVCVVIYEFIRELILQPCY